MSRKSRYELEKVRQKPLAPAEFRRRLLRFALLAVAVAAGSLGIGMVGYHAIEGQDWTDAYLNAAMILSGMGEVDPLRTEAGKIFAATYAIFSGVVFLAVAGLVFGPLIHRLLHKFHFDEDEVEDPQDDADAVERSGRQSAASPEPRRSSGGRRKAAPARRPAARGHQH